MNELLPTPETPLIPEDQPVGSLFSRALRLRCPRCGHGHLFVGWFKMAAHCEKCRFRFERAPGYFLGSAYINYGLTALITTFIYMLFHMILGHENSTVVPPLVAFVVLFPLFFFRYARSLWLAFDCAVDQSVLRDDE